MNIIGVNLDRECISRLKAKQFCSSKSPFFYCISGNSYLCLPLSYITFRLATEFVLAPFQFYQLRTSLSKDIVRVFCNMCANVLQRQVLN